MTIIYLHGFNSDGNSTTITEIRKEIPALLSISYDYIHADIAHEEIRLLIEETLKKDNDLILGGTSLGGFWANYFAQKYTLKCVLVNPALQPSVTLKRAVPESPLRNYNTGELREFTLKDADAYKKYEVPVTSDIDRVVVLGRNDEIIDYRESEKIYQNKAEIILTDEGHRIENYGRIVKILKGLSLKKEGSDKK
ncbi:MAG: YqiA/YcfP family alpha/beta fold hydrolase [Ginsengibacter sp.]